MFERIILRGVSSVCPSFCVGIYFSTIMSCYQPVIPVKIRLFLCALRVNEMSYSRVYTVAS